MNNFVIIGKLNLSEGGNKPAFSDFLTDKGGCIRTLKLNMKSGKDFFNAQIKGFLNDVKKKSDGTLDLSNSTIYSLVKS